MPVQRPDRPREVPLGRESFTDDLESFLTAEAGRGIGRTILDGRRALGRGGPWNGRASTFGWHRLMNTDARGGSGGALTQGIDASTGSRRRWLRWAPLALLGLAGLLLIGRVTGVYLLALAARVAAIEVWGPLAFVLLYVATTIALLPGSFLTLAAGALFGLVWGTIYAFTGAALGGTAAFLISRHLARRAVERRLRGNPRFGRIDRAIGRKGFRLVFLLRLSPIFPFSLLSYALGLTRVRFRDYLLASIGVLPGTLLYVYHGKMVGEVAALGVDDLRRYGPGYFLVLTVGLIATVALTVWATRITGRALREEAARHARPPGRLDRMLP